jgi:hypothetical protein
MKGDEDTGTLIELDWAGDRKTVWRRRRIKKTTVTAEVIPPDVVAAKKRFDAKIAAGFEAYALKGEGYLFEKGKQVTEFDPEMKIIFLAPRQQGGREAGYS